MKRTFHPAKTTPALFLDRDGVINLDKINTHKVADCEFLPGIFKLVKAAKNRGLKVVVVTNQSGIGRNIFTEEDYLTFRSYIHGEFKRRGCALDGEYYCPYHVEALGKYRLDSPLRKPKPGMLLKAAEELNIDLKRSMLIGDHLTDLKAAESAGVPLRLLVNGRTVSSALQLLTQRFKVLPR